MIEPLVDGAPGHGEGHNSGMPLIIAAALAVKAVMEKNHLKGRLMLWPGIAEEILGSKAFYVRDGVFKGVDACIFVHVASQFDTAYGDLGSNGMVSVEYTFHGKTAHAAGDPWDGHSALDAAEIMDVAWQFRREHLALAQRSHNVITNGGGQPNIVPGVASTWYYFREHDFKSLRELWAIGNKIADAAAMATDTTVEHKVLGTAAPNFGNKPMAEAAQANIEAVGMPKWSADDQAFAKRGAGDAAFQGPAAAATKSRRSRNGLPTRKIACRPGAAPTISAISCGRCRPSPSAILPTFPT